MIVAQFSKTKSFLITTLICVCLYYFCCLAFRAPVVENEDKFRVEGGSKFMMRGLLSAPLMSFLHQSKDGDGIQGFTTGALLTDSDNATDDSSDCSDVHQANKSQRCHFVQNTDDCQIDEGFINYNTFVYCDFDSSLVPLALIILFVWWLFLFIGLAVTADDYFCPALAVISKTLRLSHNIAGVTFLAFGNGAPDIFSAIAAIGNAKNGEAGLAFGALFGAGVFVTAVVAGTIAIIHPFDAMQRPFLRDVIFYLAAVFWTFVVMWDKEISEIEAIGFILMYIGYVLVVVVGRWYYQRTKKAMLIAEINVTNDDDDEIKDKISSAGEREPLLGNGINKPNDSSESEEGESSVWREFLSAITPIDTENWSDMGVIKKTYEVFKSPLVFLLIITTPVVDYDEDKHKWNRYLNSLQCTTGLVFSSLATQLGTKTLGGSFPVWVLVLIIGICLSLLVFCTSQNDTPPKYHPVFAFLGFLVAVIWIYSVANEVVNILQTFGVVFSISNAILGLTLLAWGNSIGDLIADTVMARQGYPRMGISACFGGPLFNLLLGIGIPFTIGTIKQGQSYKLSITFEEYVLAGFLALSLLTSLVIVPLSKFKMSRPYGITLIILYVVFLIVALLTETSVIDVKV